MNTDECEPAVAADAPDAMRFERRQTDRWGMDGAATAFEVAGDGFGRIHALRMVDCSHAGMGALSDTMIPPGTAISIGFQAPGHTARRGEVIRCLPCGDGYRLAVVFEHRLAA